MLNESSEINGIHWDVSGSCVDFQATSIAVGGEQFAGSRGSRPLRFEARSERRTYEENASFYSSSLLLVVAEVLRVALSSSLLLLRALMLSLANATWQLHMF